MSFSKSLEAASKIVTARLDNLISTHQLPAIQYVVVDAKSVCYEYANGVVDAATQDQATSATSFLSASSTKVVTAAAILQLVENGKIQLDDSLSKYFDQHPYGEAVTIRHLINQSSGIPNPLPLSWLHTDKEHDSTFSESDTLKTTLERHSKLDFEPGQKYSYSNLSYWLLGRVIEKVSGKPYKEYLREHIFEPLDISRSELDCEMSSSSVLARGHQPRFSLLFGILSMLSPSHLFSESSGRWCRYKPLYMNGPAYGGLFGTARGYGKFLQDQLQESPRIFSNGHKTKALYFSEQHDDSGALMPTTLGWHRGTLVEADNEVYYCKPGGGPGFHSNVRIYPKLGIATVYLSNRVQMSEGPINALSDELDQHFLRAAKHQVAE